MEDCGQQLEEFYYVMMMAKRLPARVVLDYLNESDNSVYLVLWFYGPRLSVCITKNGYLGLVPRKTQPGDKIILLSGGQLPFVLRPFEGHYKIVGGCYVNGIIKGEAWPANEDDLEVGCKVLDPVGT
jgi:hypothetical protein